MSIASAMDHFDRMTVVPSTSEFDAIVIGSGMGGMTTATALSRLDYKVLLLEQAQTIGGLTHAFSRNGFTWDVGLHYCGTFGHDQPAGRILNWLSGGTIKFQSVGSVYDTLHFPEGFEISVARPAAAYKMELKDHFPHSAAEIDAYFEALQSAEEALRMVAAERSLPDPFRAAHRWWNEKKIQRWCGRTTGEVIADIVADPANISRSNFLNVDRFGELRRRTSSRWRSTKISASSEARGRKNPTSAHQINRQTSTVRWTIHPIRRLQPTGLGFRQGQRTSTSPPSRKSLNTCQPRNMRA
jgi:choline dehydrogenase-like flavoprotein